MLSAVLQALAALPLGKGPSGTYYKGPYGSCGALLHLPEIEIIFLSRRARSPSLYRLSLLTSQLSLHRPTRDCLRLAAEAKKLVSGQFHLKFHIGWMRSVLQQHIKPDIWPQLYRPSVAPVQSKRLCETPALVPVNGTVDKRNVLLPVVYLFRTVRNSYQPPTAFMLQLLFRNCMGPCRQPNRPCTYLSVTPSTCRIHLPHIAQ
jgi:hypothetical protein